MDTIRRNTSSSSIVSYLIIASESGEIIILDTQSFSVLQHVSILLYNRKLFFFFNIDIIEFIK